MAFVQDLLSLYKACCLCPRACGVDRSQGQRGFCGQLDKIKIAFAGLHAGEEPILSGQAGSGTVFFTGCTLKCPSCQNYQLSSEDLGIEVGTELLATIFMRLAEKGAQNLNLVTATHFIPSCALALSQARQKACLLPVVWNTSGYENHLALSLLNQFVDIYLADLKFIEPSLAQRWLGRPDYPAVAKEALLEMVRARTLVFEHDKIKRGVIVRHLVLPGLLAETRKCLEWFAAELKGKALLSLMFQYIPLERGQRLDQVKLNPSDCELVLEWLDELGIEEGFVQELEPSDTWLPDFKRSNPFPQGCCQPLWHADYGFLV